MSSSSLAEIFKMTVATILGGLVVFTVQDRVKEILLSRPVSSPAEARVESSRAPARMENGPGEDGRAAKHAAPTESGRREPTPLLGVPADAMREAASAAPEPYPRAGTVWEGSRLVLSAQRRVCSGRGEVGFTATVEHPVGGSNGVEVPAGAAVQLVAGPTHRDPDTGAESGWRVRTRTVSLAGSTYALGAEVVETKLDTVSSRRRKVTGGVVGGAIGGVAGRVLGDDDRSVVVGAVVGSAAGAALAGGADVCIPQGGRIVVRLVEPLRIPG